jgi:hypothetical protein
MPSNAFSKATLAAGVLALALAATAAANARDAASGQASGKRIHKPLAVAKEAPKKPKVENVKVKYMEYKMQDVFISSKSSPGSGGPAQVPKADVSRGLRVR